MSDLCATCCTTMFQDGPERLGPFCMDLCQALKRENSTVRCPVCGERCVGTAELLDGGGHLFIHRYLGGDAVDAHYHRAMPKAPIIVDVAAALPDPVLWIPGEEAS